MPFTCRRSNRQAVPALSDLTILIRRHGPGKQNSGRKYVVRLPGATGLKKSGGDENALKEGRQVQEELGFKKGGIYFRGVMEVFHPPN